MPQPLPTQRTRCGASTSSTTGLTLTATGKSKTISKRPPTWKGELPSTELAYFSMGNQRDQVPRSVRAFQQASGVALTSTAWRTTGWALANIGRTLPHRRFDDYTRSLDMAEKRPPPGKPEVVKAEVVDDEESPETDSDELD